MQGAERNRHVALGLPYVRDQRLQEFRGRIASRLAVPVYHPARLM
jgi:hypothetical protein